MTSKFPLDVLAGPTEYRDALGCCMFVPGNNEWVLSDPEDPELRARLGACPLSFTTIDPYGTELMFEVYDEED